MPVGKLTNKASSAPKSLVVVEAAAGGDASPAKKFLISSIVAYVTVTKGTVAVGFLSGLAGLAVLAAGA
jgi:hypothetical protein